MNKLSKHERMTPGQVASVFEGEAEDYRTAASKEGDTRQGVKFRAKAEALDWAAKQIKAHLE